MANFISNMTDAARKFTTVDFGIFKIYLVAVGILLGLYFGDFLLKYITIVWIVAVVTLIFILAKLIRYSCNCCKKKD